MINMVVKSTGRYLGGLNVEVTHEPSGSKIRTAAPVDNQGDGSTFPLPISSLPPGAPAY